MKTENEASIYVMLGTPLKARRGHIRIASYTPGIERYTPPGPIGGLTGGCSGITVVVGSKAYGPTSAWAGHTCMIHGGVFTKARCD